MLKLNVKQRNWLLAAHVSFAALWTGTVFSMFLLALSNQDSNNADVRHTLHSAINLLDDYVVIPAAIGSVLTATFLCWLTNYGFMKFWWVITKWFLTISLIVFGTFWLYPWSVTAESIVKTKGLIALADRVYVLDAKGVLIGGAVQTVFLLFIIAISVIKPWGRRIVKENNQVSIS
ncbi:MAG: hypothetical protein KME23_25840 [Goleter apudmare HA4340-LM2]|jgi:glucan phosphoethanolaminetransferase (alkaline phosphatase superfamily)|nr:hypothetical protein [Goleter apudmare HA4340-LM2]